MRILVTGGAGFIGSWIAEALARQHEVIVVDDLSGGIIENVPVVAKFVCGDLANPDSLAYVRDIDLLVHTAANAREGASFFQPVSVVYRNTLAYANTLAHCIRQGVQRVILFSSMAVYGEQNPPFHELSMTNPVDVYGIQKEAMERMTQVMADVFGFTYTIIRPHNVFGPRQSLRDIHRNVIAIWMNRIMRKEPVYVFGDGEQQRSFSYIEDSLPCYLNAILGNFRNETFNIGGLQHVTINRMLKLVKAAMGVSNDYQTIRLSARPHEVKNAFCNHEKAERLLGYRETIGFENGIIRMAEWAKKQGPQEWKNTDPIEIVSDKIPKIWL